MNCSACLSPANVKELLWCTGCKSGYHHACLNIPMEEHKKIIQDKNNTWRCPSCNNVTRRQRGDSTPVRKHYERSPPAPMEADMSICDESRHDLSAMDRSTGGPDVSHAGYNTTTSEFNMDALAKLLDSKLAGLKKDLVMIDAKLGTTKQEIFIEMKNEFTRVMDHMKEEFTETTDFLSDQIKGFQTELSTVHKKIQTLEVENGRLNAELLSVKNSHSSSSDIAEFQEVIDQLQAELNERDQMQLLNDIEISGIPEYQDESTLHISMAVAQKIGMTLDMRDIVSAERVGPIRGSRNAARIAQNPGASQGTQNPEASHETQEDDSNEYNTRQRPRPLVVRLARRALRDQLLRNARARRGLDTTNIGLPEHTTCSVYINERLTKANRRLLWKTRQAGNVAGWKFVWTRDGRIFAKRTDREDSKSVRIKNEKEVKRVFGVDPTANNNK